MPYNLENTPISDQITTLAAEKERRLVIQELAKLGPGSAVAIRMKDSSECQPCHIEWEIVSAKSMEELATPQRMTPWRLYCASDR